MNEFKGLATSLAAELGMDPVRFGDLSILFYRFDFSCDGIIDEEECYALAESMMRHYSDALCPRHGKQVNMLNLEFKTLEANYVLKEKLGQGGQGAVHLAQQKGSGDRRVVKCFDKSNRNAPLEDIKKEFHLLRSLDHPRIQRLYDIFEDRSNVYVVSEPYLGGDLRTLTENALDAGVSVTSTWLAKVLYQAFQGVAYLHKMRVLHCDLKESNVMVANNDNWLSPLVVVIDFGLARNFVVGGGSGGTPGYMPPEVWTQGLWTARGDVHSLGVVMYQIFAMEERCYAGLSDDEIMRCTVSKPPNLNVITRYWRRCQDLVALLDLMLQKDFRKRPTVRECMEHGFFKDRVFSDMEDTELLSQDVVSGMRSLSAKSHRGDLHRAILSDMASRFNLAQMRTLCEAFAAIDADHDGVITVQEARKALLNDGLLDEAEVNQIVEALLGQEGLVPYSTFMGLLLAERAADENRLLWTGFEELDTDGTGYLDMNEVGQLLERPALAHIRAGRSPESLMELMDFDSDGKVSFEEFKHALGMGCQGLDATPVMTLTPLPKQSAGPSLQTSPPKNSEIHATSCTSNQSKQEPKPESMHSRSKGLSKQPTESSECDVGIAVDAQTEAMLSVGDGVLFWSASWKKWIEGKVIATSPSGSIQVDCKPGYWLSKTDQAERIRRDVDWKPSAKS